MTRTKYNELKCEEMRLAQELSDVRKAMQKIHNERLEAQTGIAVGKRHTEYGAEYEITRIASKFSGTMLQVYGKKIKKDGTPSIREVYVTTISVDMSGADHG